jgi:hypothetical protein
LGEHLSEMAGALLEKKVLHGAAKYPIVFEEE